MARFLTDMPASEKENQFAVHDKIADAIVEEINEDANPENRRIAIVGDWGSGKSTILSYVDERLKKMEETGGDKFCFVVFDLWSHTGDSLRRSFLMELYNSIDAKLPGTFDDKQTKQWQDVKKKLEFEQQAVLSIEKQDYSPVVIFIVLLVTLYALLHVVASAVLPFLPQDIDASKYLNVGVLLLTIVFALILGRVISKKPLKSIWHGFGEGMKEIIGHLEGHPSTRSTKTTQTETLGSLTFEKYLSEILTLTHKIAPDIKIVITLDNLDRLKAKHIRDAWDSIQLFVNHRGNVGDESKTWLLLPVSTQTIASMMGSESLSGEADVEDGIISKLFTIKYEIPAPIRSEWKESVLNQLSSAFPEEHPPEFQFVFSILNSFPDSRLLRTPRESKSVINELVALKRVYAGVSLYSIAEFAYFKHSYAAKQMPKTSNTFESYMRGILDGSESTTHLPEPPIEIDLNTELAMMTYGVFDKEKAREAFLAGEMSDIESVRNFDFQKNSHISPGIWDTIKGFLQDGTISADGEDNQEIYCELMSRIAACDEVDDEQLAARSELFRAFKDKLEESLWPLYPGSSTGVSALCAELDDEEGVLDAARRGAEKSSSDLAKADLENLKTWCNEVLGFLDDLYSRDVLHRFDSIKVDFGSNLYSFCEIVSSHDHALELIEKFAITSEQSYKQIVRSLVEERPSKSDEAGVISTLSNSDLFAEALPDVNYGDTQSLGLNNSQEILDFYFEAWNIFRENNSPCAGAYIESVIEKNQLSSDLYLSAESSFDMAALFGFYIQKSIQGPQPHDANAFLSQRHNDIGYESAERYISGSNKTDDNELYVSDVFDSLNDEPNGKLCSRVAELLVEEDGQCSGLTFDRIQQYLLMCDTARISKLEPKLASLYQPEEMASCPFYSQLSSAYLFFLKAFDSDKYLAWLRESLDTQCSEQDWKNALASEKDEALLKLAGTACETNKLPELLESNATADVNDGNLNARCSLLEQYHLIEKISKEGFAPISKVIIDCFNNGSWKSFLGNYGESLLSRRWLQELSGGDSIVVARTIISSRTLSHIDWLKNSIEGMSQSSNLSVLNEIGVLAKDALGKARKNDSARLNDALESIINECR